MQIPRESGRHTKKLSRSKGERRAGVERRLREVEWLKWPRIWVLPEPLADAASRSPHPIPWAPSLALLHPGIYAIGPALPETRDLPRGYERPSVWSQYRDRPLGELNELQIAPIDQERLRGTAGAAESSRRFPKMFPEYVGDADKWRERTFEKIGRAREAREAFEAAQNDWEQPACASLIGAAIPIVTNPSNETAFLAEPTRSWWSRHFALRTDRSRFLTARESPVLRPLLLSLEPARELDSALATLAYAELPALSEALFVAWFFSGGSSIAVRSTLEDLVANAPELSSRWDGPVHPRLDVTAVHRTVRERQPHRVRWIGAMHGLARGAGFSFAKWLVEFEMSGWEQRPEMKGWHAGCQNIEEAALHLAMGLGREEQEALLPLLELLPTWSSRFDDAVDLVRAGIDVEFVRRCENDWWELGRALRIDETKLKRLIRHPWFGPKLIRHWDPEDRVRIENPLFDWILQLPSRLMAVRPSGDPVPDSRDGPPELGLIDQIDCFVDHHDTSSRQRFLMRNIRWIGSEIVRRWKDLPLELSKDSPEEWRWVTRVDFALTIVSFWDERGFDGCEPLFARLLEPLSFPTPYADECRIVVALSNGDPRCFLDLLAHFKEDEDEVGEIWPRLEKCPRIRRALIEQPPSKLPETLARLDDLKSIDRFASRPLEDLLETDLPSGGADPSFEALRSALPERTEDIARLQTLQRSLNLSLGPSKALAKALERSESDSGARRLHRQLDSSLRTLELERVRALVGDVVRRKVTEWIGEPVSESVAFEKRWIHAMRLGTHLKSNQRTMKRLLQAEHRGESDRWIGEHPENVRFLERFERAGGNREAWLAGFREIRSIRGEPLEIHVEPDPLEVLRMGTVFGTCLSERDINAHAAVANAVDANKRVIYVRRSGRIVGRKLVGVIFVKEEDDETEKAVLVGYAVYGALPGEHGQGTPNTRRTLVEAVDTCCMAWAKRCGIETAYVPERQPDRLVARDGYFDPQYEWLSRKKPPRSSSSAERS